MSAGLETINILRENREIYDILEKRTGELVKKTEELIEKYGIKATVNHIGSLYTIFFSDKKVKNLEDAIATDDKAYNTYFSVMLEDGIIVPPSKYEAHFISWAHNDEDFEKLIAGTEKSFAAISRNSEQQK